MILHMQKEIFKAYRDVDVFTEKQASEKVGKQKLYWGNASYEIKLHKLA